MLQEQTLTFSDLFLFDLMIWLQVSFYFDCFVSAEEHFALFLFSFSSTVFLAACILAEEFFSGNKKAEMPHHGGVKTTRALCGLCPLGYPRS